MDEGTKEDLDLQIRGDPVIQTLRLGGGGAIPVCSPRRQTFKSSLRENEV